jgi:hypothetical protein
MSSSRVHGARGYVIEVLLVSVPVITLEGSRLGVPSSLSSLKVYRAARHSGYRENNK